MAVHERLQEVFNAASTDAIARANAAQAAAITAALAQQATLTRGGMQPPSPRLVAARRAPLVLSQTWQRIEFSGTGTLDANLFPFISGSSGAKRVDWFAAEKVLRFAAPDQNYAFQLDFTITGGLRPCDIFYRFVIPVPGAPIYFPAADGVQQGHLCSIERLLAPLTANLPRIIYVGPEMHQYGLGIELLSSTSLLTHPTVSQVDLFIFA